MNIWIFQTGEPLHGDPGAPRPMRAMNLANALIQRGHKVVIWSSSFYHQEKRHRYKVFTKISISNELEICYVPSPGYSKNIGLGRLFDHAVLARNLSIALNLDDLARPDIAFIGYPPIEYAYVASRWLGRNKIPYILDVKDQWPDIFVRAFPKFLSRIAKLIFYPYFYLGRRVMRDSIALCSMTDAFSNWARLFSGRVTHLNDFVLPLAPVLPSPSNNSLGISDGIKEWLHGKKIYPDEGVFRIFFVGNFMASAFNFEPIIRAAELAIANGYNWQIVLCGDGDRWDSVRERCLGLPNVILPGRVDRDKMLGVSNISNIGVAPILNTPDYLLSIPNKIIDYFSLGLPVVTSLGGEVEKLINKWDAGLKYSDEDPTSLFKTLLLYFNDGDLIARQSNNSRLLYDCDFDGAKIYQNVAMRLEQIMMASR